MQTGPVSGHVRRSLPKNNPTQWRRLVRGSMVDNAREESRS